MLLLSEILVARLVGVEQFGAYALASSWVYILALLGTLGFNQALLKLVSNYASTRDWALLRGVVRTANLWTGVVALSASGLGYLVLFGWQQPGGEAVMIPAFAAALAIVPVCALCHLRQAVLRGLGRVWQALLPDFVLRPALFIVLVLAFSRWTVLDAYTVLLLSLLAFGATLFIGAWWQHRHMPAETHAASAEYRHREWMALSLPMLLIVALNLTSSRMDLVLLGLMAPVEQVGVYSAASRLADVVVFSLVSANTIAAPMIARLYASGRHEELQHMVSLASKGIFLLTLPVVILLLLFGQPLLSLFGAEFSEGFAVLAILVCGQLVNALAGPVGYLMTMTGHQVSAARMIGIAACLNLTLNLVLIPAMGMVGAAIATATSVATWNILMLRFVRAKLSIRSSMLQFMFVK